MNKKSFFLGVFVGILVTWTLSFYLYYSLNSTQTSRLTKKIQKNIFNFESEENDDSGEVKIISNSIIGSPEKQFVAAKESYFKSKLKKEKEKRKISQKLLDELRPVTITEPREFGIIKSVEDQYIRDLGYKTHAFNVLVSNELGSFRDIPDTRHKV